MKSLRRHPPNVRRRAIGGRFSGRLSALVRGRHHQFRIGSGFFYQLVASLGDYAVFTTDLEGNISSWNSAAQRVFGYTETEIIGKPFSIIFSPEERRRGDPQNELRNAAKHGRMVDEAWHVRKDGTKFWAAGAVFPLLDTTGAIRGYTKIAQDLTEGKLREETARSAAELVQLITDALPALVAYVDRKHRYLFHNKAYKDWFGDRAVDIRGKHIEEVVGQAAYDTVRPHLNRALRGERITVEIEVPFVSGTRWIHADYIPDRDKSGEVRGIVSLVTDITSTKETEIALRKSEAALAEAKDQIAGHAANLEKLVAQRTARLKQLNEELSTFTYSASHDLRAPLRKVDAFVQMLVNHAGDTLDQKSRNLAGRIREATKSMNRLIDDMLNLAGVTQRTVDQRIVNLSDLVIDIAGELRKSQPGRLVDLKVAPGIRGKGDSHLLRIALQNLLDNAWKFTKPRPIAKIGFGSSTAGKDKVYFIKDNGVGFDMRFAHKIFMPFERLHRIEDFPGTGVGLAIVKRAIERHGGRLWVKSKEGEGTTVFFTLHQELVR